MTPLMLQKQGRIRNIIINIARRIMKGILTDKIKLRIERPYRTHP